MADTKAALDVRIRAVFEEHGRASKEGGGKRLGAAELAAALDALGVRVNGQAGLRELLAKIDAERSGDLWEFVEFKTLFEAARLRRVFDAIDSDGSGSISTSEMKNALKMLGVRATRAEADRMIRAIDHDHDNTVSWGEFYAAFQAVPVASLQAIVSKWTALSQVDAGSDLAPLLPHSDLTAWQTVVAGGCAGVASRTATAPLERIKLAAQTGNLRGGIAAALRQIYAQEGVRGLFRGNLANCLRVFPTGGITLTAYLSFLKLTPADRDLDAMEPVYRIACAGSAAAVGNTITYPLDLVRARMTLTPSAAGSGTLNEIPAAFQRIYRAEGLVGFFRGLRPTLVAVMPFVALQQTTVDLSKAFAGDCGWDPSPPVLMLCGASAGLLAQTCVYPLDVMRRRMQLGPEARGGVAADWTWLALRSVMQKEGVRSLFAGIVPTYIKTVPTAMVGATVCVSLVQHFQRQSARHK